MAYGHDESIHL